TVRPWGSLQESIPQDRPGASPAQHDVGSDDPRSPQPRGIALHANGLKTVQERGWRRRRSISRSGTGWIQLERGRITIFHQVRVSLPEGPTKIRITQHSHHKPGMTSRWKTGK